MVGTPDRPAGQVLDDLGVLQAARAFERELSLSLPWPSLT